MKTLSKLLFIVFIVWFFTIESKADCETDVPYFGSGGPQCTPERQEIACGCTEYMDWDAITFPEVAQTCEKWYQVYHREVPSQTWLPYGSTRWRPNQTCTVDENDVTTCTENLETRFFFAWGGIGELTRRFVTPDVLYEFSVKACYTCGAGVECSENYSNPVRYRAAPYRCYENGAEVPCG